MIDNSVKLEKMSLTEYIKRSIRISKSIHIKLDTLATLSRIVQWKLFRENVLDCYGNRYCLNLAGIHYDRDVPVMVYVPDIQKEMILTPDLVNEYEILAKELKTFGNFYDNLVSKYPEHITYIKGCIAGGFTIDKIIESNNGEILWYNNELFNSDNKLVMHNVQNFIYDFLKRYDNDKYVIDELYPAGLVSNLYSVLPAVILTEKLKYVLTSNADDFHILQYFRSYKFMDEDITVLDRKTLTWLYGALSYIKTNIGKNEVLDMLLDKVFNDTGLGIGKTLVVKSRPIATTVEYNSNTYISYDRKTLIERVKANDKYSISLARKETFEDILEKEYSQGYLNDYNKVTSISMEADEKFRFSIPTQETSKVLEIDKLILLITDDVNKFTYFINSLIYEINNDSNGSYLMFHNPSDGIVYNLNSRQVFALLLKLMFNIYYNKETNPTIGNLYYTNILDVKKAKNYEFEPLPFTGNSLKDIVNEITNDFKNLPKDITTLERFNKYFDISFKVMDKFWFYLSNVNDVLYSMDLMYLFNSFFISGNVDLVNGLKLSDLEKLVNFPNMDIAEPYYKYTFKKLIETIIGRNIYDFDLFNSKIAQLINIFKKTNGYTVQILLDNKIPYTITGEYQTLKPSTGMSCFASVMDSDIRLYDKVDKRLYNRFIKISDKVISKNSLYTFSIYGNYRLKLQNIQGRNMIDTGICFTNFGNRLPDFYKPIFNKTTYIPKYDIDEYEVDNTKKILERPVTIRSTGDEITTGVLSKSDSTVYKADNGDLDVYSPLTTGYITSLYKPPIYITDEEIGEHIKSDKVYSETRPVIPKLLQLNELTESVVTEYSSYYRLPKIFSPETNLVTNYGDTINENESTRQVDVTEFRKLKIDSTDEYLSTNIYLNKGINPPSPYKPGIVKDSPKIDVQDGIDRTITRVKPETLNIVSDNDNITTYIEKQVTDDILPAGYSPSASGYDPNDDIVIDNLSNIGYELPKRLIIGEVDEVSELYIGYNDNRSLKHLTPDIIYPGNVNMDISQTNKDIDIKTIPPEKLHITKNNEITDTYQSGNTEVIPENHKPDASGYDPNEDIVQDKTTNMPIADNIDTPTIHVNPDDEVNDIPIIHIQT